MCVFSSSLGGGWFSFMVEWMIDWMIGKKDG